MKKEFLIDSIVERLSNCADDVLLDLILRLLIESGY